MKKKKIVILVVLLLILILLIVLLKTVSLGYEVEYTIYDEETGSQTVALGVPKLSFFKRKMGIIILIKVFEVKRFWSRRWNPS